MKDFLEKAAASFWNRRAGDGSSATVSHAMLDIGARVVDGEPVGARVGIPQNRRAESIALIGKTGTGKTSLIRHLQDQDIRGFRYFAACDLHGEETPFLLKTIAVRERAVKSDLSDRLIVIDPADRDFSVG